jgi:hypothetical protein
MNQAPAGPEDPASGDVEETSPTGEVSIQRIQVLHLGLLAVAAVAGLLLSARFAAGVAAGGVLMAANFRVIAAVIRSVFLKQSAAILNAGLYWVKFLALMGLIGFIVLWFRVDIVGFLIGLTMIFVAVTLEAVLRLIGR